VLTKTELFEAGKGGYLMYRIPGIVVTSKGTVLAYCEARKKTGSDWDAIDILLRRSTDGGKTWSEPHPVSAVEGKIAKNPVALKLPQVKPDDLTINNPVAVIDRQTGAVHFLYCVEYARCFYRRSDDDGQTFSKPVEITAAFEKLQNQYPWKVLATGPGHGIQLQSGRLLVPIWLSTGTGGGAHRPSCLSVLYSDDHGLTWQPGDIVAADPRPKNPNESVTVQLADGRVLVNIRHEAARHFRGVSISPDGISKWSPVYLDEQLPEPICFGSIVRLTQQPAYRKNRLLFVNPHNPTDRTRKNLTVKMSHDEAQTWPVARTLEAGLSGYADLAVGRDGSIYCLYERGGADGNHFHTRFLTLARFNLEWLTDGKDHLDPAEK
jgi:sialidase-1